MVKLWNARTPSKFRFSAKFPQVITHVKKFRNCQKELELFYEAMEPLKDKLLTLLIQFPPSLKIKEGLEALDQYDFYLDDTYRYYCFSHITLLPYCQIHKVIPFRSNELVICIVVTPERLDTTQCIKLAILLLSLVMFTESGPNGSQITRKGH